MPPTAKTTPSKYVGKAVASPLNSAAWRQEQLDEAIENYAYWKRVAAATENPLTKSHALALASLWKSTLHVRSETVRMLAGKP